ncbi:MAG: HAD family hydrolase [Candidatus Binatia bacterium]
MQLIIFDVDGTLTRSTGVDARCYAQAVSVELGVDVDTEWSRYRHVTDAGILRELLERRGRPAAPAVVLAVRERFLRLLCAALAADPTSCREVAGAGALLRHLRGVPDVRLAIATGGWADSARLKLRQAHIEINGIPFGSSDDSPSREDILRIACQRAGEKCTVPFDAVTYVGDAPWDAAAARLLGFRFIGVALEDDEDRPRMAGASVVFRDFTNRDAVVDALLAG